MARKQRVRLTTGTPPNLYQAGFVSPSVSARLIDPDKKRSKERGETFSYPIKDRRKHQLQEKRRAYHTIRDCLFRMNYGIHLNTNPNHDCYEKKDTTQQIVFFVHMPNEQVGFGYVCCRPSPHT